MKLIYLTVDGRELTENWKVNSRILEEPDGYHPVTNDSVWQDSKRLRPPRMIIIQGVTPPFGAIMAHEDMKAILKEKIIAEHGFKHPSVSKIWVRWISNIIDWVITRWPLLFVGIAMAVGIVTTIWK